MGGKSCNFVFIVKVLTLQFSIVSKIEMYQKKILLSINFPFFVYPLFP